MARIFAIYGDVYYGSYRMTGLDLKSYGLHETAVPRRNLLLINHSDHSLTAYFLDLPDSRRVYFLAVSILDAQCDRMRRVVFSICRILQDLFLRYRGVVDASHREVSLRYGSRLVKGNGFNLRQGLHVVGTLYEDTPGTGSSESRKKSKRDTYDKGAGAANYQEGAGSENPVPPDGSRTFVAGFPKASKH